MDVTQTTKNPVSYSSCGVVTSCNETEGMFKVGAGGEVMFTTHFYGYFDYSYNLPFGHDLDGIRFHNLLLGVGFRF